VPTLLTILLAGSKAWLSAASVADADGDFRVEGANDEGRVI
jgi:hypothetical protein